MFFINKKIKIFIKNKIIKSYNTLSIYDLQNLKIIEKNLLDLKFFNNNEINKSLSGYLYNYLIMPYFSKLYIFFYSFNLKLIFPLPLSHITFLKKKNIKCNALLSVIFFYFFIFLLSIKKYFITIIKILKNNIHNTNDNSINVFFPKVDDRNMIPTELNKFNEYTFIISSINALKIKPDFIYHNNKNIKKMVYDGITVDYGNPINALSSLNKFNFIFLSLIKLLKSLFLLFINRWHSLYFIDQDLLVTHFLLSKNNTSKTNHIIYSFQDQCIRPLWTYKAEKKNYIFHLINCASGYYGFKNHDGSYPTDTMFPHLNCWNNYFVDSPIFYKHIKKIIPTSVLLTEKISPFHCNQNISFLSNTKITITIFDVVPHTMISRALILPEDRYRVSKVCINFLNDILKCLDLFDVQILIKTKHSINNNSYPNDYINYINAIDSNKVSFINPRFSPKLLASISDFSISAPFTTAAFFKTKTNNNIFYDSENIIFKDDRARQNLNVINGYNELLTSVSKIINNIKSSK